MRIEPKQCEIFTIHDVPRLDAITVILQDFGNNAGQLTVICYGRAWTAFWGSMGGTLREFLSQVNAGYVTGKMCLPCGLILKKQEKREAEYLMRIIGAVLAAIKPGAADAEEL